VLRRVRGAGPSPGRVEVNRPGQERAGYYLLVGLSIAGVFAIDLVTFLGMGVWVLYFVPLFLCLFGPRPAAPVAVAVVCTLLVGSGYLLAPHPPQSELLVISQLNRALAAAALLGLGVVGRQFVLNQNRVRLQEWLGAGQTELSARMQGEREVGELAQGVLSFLAEYAGALVGSVWVEDGAGRFVRKGVYGLEASGQPAAEEVGEGETLIGRAASDAKLLVVQDLPDDYAEVRSGVGSAKPRALALAPAIIDGQVIGVVELGFFTPPSAAARALLAQVSESIGAALRSAEYRRRQAELLEQTQAQAEELQAQQEELRVVNEELVHQGEALQASQAELEENNAQLEEQAAALENQKEQLSSTQDVLRRKAVDLERASRYKSEFLANMSHELRTPLNSALILAKLLADNKQGNLTPDQIQCATHIYNAGNDLLTLINDILDLSKIEAGKLDLSFESIEIGELFETVRQRFAPLASEKQIALTARVEPGTPQTIETDRLRLQQILTNLLSNALKFTETGEIRLLAGPGEADQVLISVDDTGIGIPADQQQAVFEAFRQANGTSHKNHGGTGLGLSICRELVELLGGTIRLKSAPGEGSRFTVALPMTPPRRVRAGATRRPAAPLAQSSGSGRPRPAPRASDDDRAALGSGARTLLVIEDDPVFAQILRDLAHELDFRCVIAQSAEEGLRLARELRPLAILLDIGLPDHSGLTVLELLKRDLSARHIPVQVLSVHDYERVARELGVVGYALKPVKREELASAIRRLEQESTPRAKSVLIVEDDDTQRSAISELLRGERVSTRAVPDADQAAAALDSDAFDCVVLDLGLPGQSGFTLLDRLAAGKSRPLPPVVVYTARALSRAEEQRLRKRASSVIVKGARSPERLVEEVTLFLHQKESELDDDKRELLRSALDREALFQNRRLLVVEDDVRNIFALTSALEPKGAEIEIARNGLEALRRLESHPPIDLVLMDLMMPEMDGLTAIREIRKRAEWLDLPILALTAKAMPDDRLECLDAGANDYIAKPVDMDKLLSLIRVWMPRP
jgi:signal transduction histidine kinase/CheY-like chemotaxis protein